MPRVIRDILKWAAKQDYPATLVGAAAVCLHGPVRPTDDIDLLVMTTDAPEQVLASLVKSGYEPRYDDAAAFANAARVLLVRHTGTGIDVDVMLGMLPFEQHCVDTSIVKKSPAGPVRVAAPESLCVMKLIAGRPHDLRDVAQLVATFPLLDRKWILEQLRQYADLMEQPDVLEFARRTLT